MILAGMNAAFEKAIELAGGVVALASKLNMSQSRISNWRTRGVPTDAAALIDNAFGGAVRAEEFFPDIEFDRDGEGHVIGYRVKVGGSEQKAA